MTATERVRELLDERGVEYTANERDTQWWPKDNPAGVLAENSRYPSDTLDVYGLTPEQAIAATLGDVPRLPHWWTHDGTLHIELPKLPESISVRLPAQRDREVGSARVWQYMRDSGTCHECAGMDDMFECSACGGRYEGWALKRWARYCPDCGRRIEVDG